VDDVLDGVVGGARLAERLRMAARPAAGEPGGAPEVEAGGRTFQASIATVQGRAGQPMGRVAVLQDVTDFKAVDRLKSEFLSGVSHDLLSPLTYMGNYADLLLESADATPEREYAERIRGGIDRMTLLVNDLLEMARVEAGVNVQFDRVAAGELLREVALEYASPARLAGVQLVVEAPPDLPPVMADPVLLRRAVTNLVTNALKYAPDSGLATLRAERRAGELLISVRDRGPGIAPAERERLFEKFYRGQQTAAERARGSGLGLAIVKSIAEHHGGRVWCESEVGVGSVFGLALPLNQT
jgi:signal transduction histidine kinase